MKRLENWETKLFNFIETRRYTPMVWGKTDCFMLVYDSYKIITGVNPEFGQTFRGKYKTEKGAYRLIKKYSGGGLGDVCGIVANNLKALEKPVNYAQKGDIALFQCETVIGGVRDIMGIVLGVRSALQGENGLIFMDTIDAKRIWKI